MAETPDELLPPEERPQPLGVNYLPGSGDMMVYGGVVVAALGVLTWIVRGDPVFLTMVPVGLLVCAYFYPLIEKGVPRLAADNRGLYFERLGIVPWEAVKSVRHQQRALRSLRLHTLYVELAGTPQDVVSEPEPVSPFRRFMARAWKSEGNRITVELHPLAKDPVNLVNRLLAFRPDLMADIERQRAEREDGF